MTDPRKNAVRKYLIHRSEAMPEGPASEAIDQALEARLRYWEVHGKLPPSVQGPYWMTLEKELNRLAAESVDSEA